MRIIVLLAICLFCIKTVQAQVGTSISSDGTAPNTNAMLDVKSPASGDGKGILIPRVTGNQRTNANASLAGGLLNDSGELRGGAAQGLIVYQTNGAQGLYFNTSQVSTPAWVYLGASTTNYLPLTGGTMSGALNMGGQIITNVGHVDFAGTGVSIGRSANGVSYGVAIGNSASGTNDGAALGYSANGSFGGAAMGHSSDGYDGGAAVGSSANGSHQGAAVGIMANGAYQSVALGYMANGYNSGAALGNQARGTNYGAAVGPSANGSGSGAAVGYGANGSFTGVAVGASANGVNYGAAVGYQATGSVYGAALGYGANGTFYGVAVGYAALGTNYGAALGRSANGADEGAAMGYAANGSYYGAVLGKGANGYSRGAAMGYLAIGTNFGAAMGAWANGKNYGAAMGRDANGINSGAALGYYADGNNSGAALGYYANGARTNVAIGYRANAMGGTNHIAIGYNVTNNLGNDTAVIRGHVYMDGGTGLFWRATFGEGSWTAKAFEIDHPLDPENKILRHFCLEGPQVWNVYAGNIQLVNGQAIVQLPNYYSALNLVGSEIYSLTPLGDAFVWVAGKVSDNRFVIAGKQDIEVSWTIKVLRNDPGCREDLRRRPVEQRKNEIR